MRVITFLYSLWINTLGTKERYTVVINKGEDKAKAQYDGDMKLDGLKLTESNEELPIIP